jgi:hypothetical protein
MPTIEPSHLNSVRLLPAYFHPLGSVQSNGGFRETKLLSVMTEIGASPDYPVLADQQKSCRLGLGSIAGVCNYPAICVVQSANARQPSV